jgi:hypothetical protein
MSALLWEDFRDAHNHFQCAANSAQQAMFLAMAGKPAAAHHDFMQACLAKAADRLGYRLVPVQGGSAA